MNNSTVTCYKYSDWKTAHSTHAPDFGAYMFDVLPIDEFCVNNLTSYIGSAGANVSRIKETRTVDKKGSTYVKQSFDARYRGGSYTRNHTRPQEVYILTTSRNIRLLNESSDQYYKRVNTPGYKQTEKELIGIIEYQLYQCAQHFGILLNNNEVPKHIDNELSRLSFSAFFSEVEFIGDIPFLIQLGLGEISIQDVREHQRLYCIDYAKQLIQQHQES